MSEKRAPPRTNRKHPTHREAEGSPRSLLFEVLAGLDTGVAVVSTNGVLLYANPVFAGLMGFVPYRRFKGSNLKDYISARSWADLDSALQQAMQQTVQGDVTVALAGRTRTVRLVFSLIARDKKNLLRITASEVTELVETNKALDQSRASLQSLSARILQVEDEERRRIARDLHDNTGQEIAALMMALRQAEAHSSDVNPEVSEAISDSIAFASNIEKQIRTLSYLLHPPLLDELGLRAAIDWFIAGFTERSGIQLTVDIPEPLLRFSLRQEIVLFRVVQSSLANVLRHSGSSTARIHITLDAAHVRLFVEDHGKGMTVHHLQAARQGLASGIGIGGMRERLRELGGTLEVNSGKNGTQVIATLPIERKDEAEAPPFQSSDPPATTPGPSPSPGFPNGRKRILIVDDHEVTRQGIRTLLASQSDLEVVGEAADGVEALAKTSELKPDLVILDMTMPRLGGLAVATKLRESGSVPKILIFTSHSFPGLQRTLRMAGCHGYILKENAGTDLATGIQEVLHGAEFYCPHAS